MVKFIIIGHKRCGSTLLTGSLSCHSNVYMFGEVFNESIEEREKAYEVGLRGCSVALRRNITKDNYYSDGDAATFLNGWVYYERYWEPVAVGFKIFYDHCREESMKTRAWNYLCENNDIRIIHLVRLNLLESFLSFTLAKKTNVWAYLKDTSTVIPSHIDEPIYLSPKICEEYFLEITRKREETRKLFCNHQLLEITYEYNLCMHYQETFDQICDFLKVPKIQAQLLFEKQAKKKPSLIISNYNELKQYFGATAFATMFVD